MDWDVSMAHLPGDRDSRIRLIQLREVGLRFDDKPALFEGVNLDIDTDSFILIEGTSGCGKSSFLRLLNRLQDPTHGDILLDGGSPAESDMCALRRQLAWVQQTPVMLHGSVADNLTTAFRYKTAGDTRTPERGALRQWLDSLLMTDVDLDDDATVLSVGQQQRLSLIRSLLVGPSFLLCDEPTSALDADSKEIVETWLERAHVERGIGVVLVTHLPFELRQAQPRRYAMRGGAITEVSGG